MNSYIIKGMRVKAECIRDAVVFLYGRQLLILEEDSDRCLFLKNGQVITAIREDLKNKVNKDYTTNKKGLNRLVRDVIGVGNE